MASRISRTAARIRGRSTLLEGWPGAPAGSAEKAPALAGTSSSSWKKEVTAKA
jgi:hypothetical protein